MPELVLYHMVGSPPSWAVRMLAEILGLQLELKIINLPTLENKTPEFKKLNPMGTLPVLQDGDFVVSESHAIIMYLLKKFGSVQHQWLYPTDLRECALVDQAMYFDTGVAFPNVKTIIMPVVFDGVIETPEKVLSKVNETYSIVEMYLSNHRYIALDRFTVADFSVGTTVIALVDLVNIDAEKYPRTVAWLEKLHQEPLFNKIAVPGSKLLAQFVKTMAERNKNK